MSSKKKLTLMAFSLMLLTSVFGVTNIGIGFYRMGYAAVPMFVIGAIFFFIPFLFMMIEFGTAYKEREGGIYLWMRESVNARFALYGVFMWYASYVLWMMNKSLNMWTPLSVGLFGEDYTASDDPTVTIVIGILAIIMIVVTTLLISNGASKFSKVASIGGIAVLTLTSILLAGGIIVLIGNGFELAMPFTVESLYTSPNPAYQSIIPFLGFLVFAVFAFGGVEAMAGISDELENPERDLKKGIYMSGVFISVAYICGFIAVGAIMDWAMFPEGGTNSLNTLYIIMANLGYQLGEMFGLNPENCAQLLARFSGIGMFLAFLGAFITLAYAPLKQLISATPASYWPKSFTKVNDNGIYVGALWFQAIMVITLVATKVLSGVLIGEGANKLFDILLTMTNVGMTIPYLFLIFAWYKFRQDDSLEKGLVMFKSKTSILFWTIATMTIVAFGNFFTIIDPFIQAINATDPEVARSAFSTGFWTVIGPIIFMLMATLIYNRAPKEDNVKSYKSNKSNKSNKSKKSKK